MNPIRFECQQLLPISGDEVCAAISDMDQWSKFEGYAFLPGIERAEYEIRTADMVGSRIQVRNRDGSSHVEEIYRWLPGREIGMKLHQFSPPLSYLASHFTEDWLLEKRPNGTHVTRTFHLYPGRSLARPLLWFISLFFRRAIAKSLAQMAATPKSK